MKTGVSPRKFETPAKTPEPRKEVIPKTTLKPISQNMTQIKGRNYSLNQMNRKMKVAMTMAKANF